MCPLCSSASEAKGGRRKSGFGPLQSWTGAGAAGSASGGPEPVGPDRQKVHEHILQTSEEPNSRLATEDNKMLLAGSSS